jgi:hypothetical protein
MNHIIAKLSIIAGMILVSASAQAEGAGGPWGSTCSAIGKALGLC